MATKIFIAGHRGLGGSAIIRQLRKEGFQKLVVRTHQELDLTDLPSVYDFFRIEKPDWVFLSAAKVGGIHSNNTFPVEFLLENLKIQNNVIEASYQHKIKKLLFLGSSCIYPKLCPQPMKEEYFLSGHLEPTNEAYAIAKIAGIKLCNAMNRQYGTNFISVMPCNLYGLNDNYHLENAHALPMLLRRFHEAKEKDLKKVIVWGSGTPRREYMFADDLAKACIFLMKNYNSTDIGEFINIGTGTDVAIIELAELIKEVVGYKGRIILDPSKPDGTPQKLLEISKLKNLGWNAKTSLREGLEKTYSDFLNNSKIRL